MPKSVLNGVLGGCLGRIPAFRTPLKTDFVRGEISCKVRIAGDFYGAGRATPVLGLFSQRLKNTGQFLWGLWGLWGLWVYWVCGVYGVCWVKKVVP